MRERERDLPSSVVKNNNVSRARRAESIYRTVPLKPENDPFWQSTQAVVVAAKHYVRPTYATATLKMKHVKRKEQQHYFLLEA